MSNYLESASGFAQAVAELAKNITLGRFLKWAFTIIILAAAVFYLYDSIYTSTSFYDRTERKLSILEKVQAISNGDSSIKVETYRQLLAIAKDLEPPKPTLTYLSRRAVDRFDLTGFIKFASAFVFPFLVLLGNRKVPNKGDMVLGAIVYGVIFGVVGFFVPVVRSLWWNVALMPIVQLVVILPFVWKRN